MRVLQVMASPGWGGLEKVFVDLTNRLASSCDVIALTPEGAAVLDRLSGDVAEIATLPRGSRRNPVTLWRLAAIMRDIQPDVVHSHAAKAAEMVHWATLWTGHPHLATKHNTRSRRIFRRVDRVAAVSRAVARTVDHRRGVTVVYNGIEPRLTTLDGGERPRPSDLGEGVAATEGGGEPFTIVAVGRLHRAKGFDLLIRQVADLDIPYRLRIAGEGPERRALQELIEELDLGDRVELLGHREDVPDLLAGAHVQVVSSRTEGFSLALVEGLFYANALLSTPVGIAPEVLPDELIVEGHSLGRALRALRERYDDGVTRLAEARRRKRDLFLLSETARRYVELYEEIVGERDSVRRSAGRGARHAADTGSSSRRTPDSP